MSSSAPGVSTTKLTQFAAALILLAGIGFDARGETAGGRFFYLGNSLTALTHPAWQPELGKVTGHPWEPGAFLGAGWPSWMHLFEVERALGRWPGQPAIPSVSRGSLTLAPNETTPPREGATRFLEEPWDGVVIQIFGSALRGTTRSARGAQFTEDIPTGDETAICGLIRLFLDRNPGGRVWLYSVWPIMPAGEDRVVDGKRIRGAEFPQRDRFDYQEAWNFPYPGDPLEAARRGIRPSRTRSYVKAVVATVRAAFPELTASGRLKEIPGGELLSEIDLRLKRGSTPGLSSAKDLYTDVQHLRAGVGHYAATALFFAALFGADPAELPVDRFNDQAAYGEDVSHDFGEVIPVTPERALLVHEAVRDVLRGVAR